MYRQMRNKAGGMRCDAGEHGACGINTAGRGRAVCVGDTKCMTETRVCAGNSEHMVGPQCVREDPVSCMVGAYSVGH